MSRTLIGRHLTGRRTVVLAGGLGLSALLAAAPAAMATTYSGPLNLFCVSTNGDDSNCGGVAVSDSGRSDGSAAVSGSGYSQGNTVAVSGEGDARGLVPISGTGDAYAWGGTNVWPTGNYVFLAFSGTGNAYAMGYYSGDYGLAASGTGNATTRPYDGASAGYSYVAVTGGGHASGGTAVSVLGTVDDDAYLGGVAVLGTILGLLP